MKNKRLVHVLLNLVPSILFILLVLTVALRHQWVARYDHTITSFVQSFRTPTLDGLVKIYTQIGNSLPFTLISLVIVLCLVLKKYYRTALFLISNIILGPGINHLVKLVVQRNRPVLRLIKIDGYSFPSGHSAAAMVLFGSLIFMTWHFLKNRLWQTLLSIVWLIMMLLLGLSRIYLNVHFPTDVTAGLLLGLIVLQITTHLFYGKEVFHHAR
jgi:undecaprenyl-diphosphatase